MWFSCVGIYVYVYTRALSTFACIYVHVNIYVCVCLCLFVLVCMLCVYAYVRACVCVCVCVNDSLRMCSCVGHVNAHVRTNCSVLIKSGKKILLLQALACYLFCSKFRKANNTRSSAAQQRSLIFSRHFVKIRTISVR